MKIPFFISLLWGYILSVYASSLHEQLASIPDKDRCQIENLFQNLVFYHQFGYTLLGTKALAISGYFEIEPCGNWLLGRKVPQSLKKPWETWLRYQILFPLKNFLLFHEYDEENHIMISLINKQKFLQCFNSHKTKFISILGECSGETLLQEIEQKKCLLKALHNDEELLGILLGFGEKNSYFFKRFHQLHKVLNAFSLESFSLYRPIPSQGFKTIEEEYAHLCQQINPFEKNHLLDLINPVVFLSIKNDLEGETLRKKYRKTKSRLSLLCTQKNTLEYTLKQLTQGDNP